MRSSSCAICWGYGFWADGTAPMGPMDASDGMPTMACPQCGANPNPAPPPESGRQRKRRERLRERERQGLAYQVHEDRGSPLYRGDRLEPDAPGEHVWTVMAAFRVSADAVERNLADRADRSNMLLLDYEALAYVTPVGCFTCEQVYTSETAYAPCPGDPTRPEKVVG
jgi:hypothetical protein